MDLYRNKAGKQNFLEDYPVMEKYGKDRHSNYNTSAACVILH